MIVFLLFPTLPEDNRAILFPLPFRKEGREEITQHGTRLTAFSSHAREDTGVTQ